MKKRLALFLAMVLLLSGFPAASFAEEAEKGTGKDTVSLEETPSAEEESTNHVEAGNIEVPEKAVRVPASGFDALKNAAKSESEIEVSGDYLFTEPIVIENKSVVIKNDGEAVFKRAAGYHGRFFEVKEGGKLTVLSDDEKLIFDGEGGDPGKGYQPGANVQAIPGRPNNKMNGALIDVANGELIVGGEGKGPKFVDDKNIDSGMYVAALGASGPKGKIIFNGGEVSGMRYGSYGQPQSNYSAGAFTVGDHAELVLNDGFFTNNHTQVKNFDDLTYNDQKVRESLAPFDYKTMIHEGSAGVARLDIGAKMTMNGGLMQKNISDAGAIWVGAYEVNINNVNDSNIDTWEEKANAEFIMNGGTIDGNWGITNKSAGGIIGMFHADLTINGGTISNNKGEVGGVLAWDHYRYNNRIALRKRPYSDWTKKFKVTLEVNGGEFTGNQALKFGDYLNFIPTLNYPYFSPGEGGAIYVGTADAMIGRRGKNQVLIHDNYAQDEGGGIFVSKNPYQLLMGGTVMTGNDAENSYGGLFQDGFAPIVKIFPENGATITNNVIGEGMFSDGKDIGKLTTADLQILPNYTKVGSKIDYYTYDFRPIDKKLKSSDEPVIFKREDNAYTEAILRDKNALSLEDTYSRVIIKDNKSRYAGGVAVYGSLYIGSDPVQMIFEDGKPKEELRTLSATSEIHWAGLKDDVKTEKLKDEDINISLYRTLDGVDYLVDDLIEGNKTTYITMLPKNIYGTDVRENTRLKSEKLEALGFKIAGDLYHRDEEEPVKEYNYNYHGPRTLRAENYKFQLTILPPDFAPESWYEDGGPTVDGKTYHKLTIDPNGGTFTKGEKAYWVADDFAFTTKDLPVEIQKDGKNPVGYAYEKDGTLIKDDEMIRLSGDRTIYAIWNGKQPNIVPGSESKDNPDVTVYHKLALDPDGGTLTGENFYWVKDGYGLTADDLKGTKVERDGYDFIGWLRDGKKIHFPLKVTDAMTLKAGWKKTDSGDNGNIPEPPGSGFIPMDPIDKPGINREKVFVKGYVRGYPDRTVRAEEKITRSEAAAMLARACELDVSDKTQANFPDTPDGWYNAYIHAVVKEGIMEGYPDGTFRPDQAITRAEFAKMIEISDRDDGVVAPFDDIRGHWAEDFINRAYGNGRIDGYPDGTFRPNDGITRAEAVKIINARIGRKADSADDLVLPANYVDLKDDHWAYIEILLASDHWIWK
ncbi:MAG: S-layer homology domain-containing protein [Peptoniphilus sp.]|nr:S-layer homology domain-containing protein [Peptoniphilus sp.]MDD7363037.1 S-layer homology domain-containing protein [Bacillota bacterium]MDY6045302.1 S-layer homology domain-containing protein [Peptoniphilus sp.]